MTIHEIDALGPLNPSRPFSIFPADDSTTHETCDHLYRAIVRREADAIIARCCKALREQDYDTLAFSGNSGALIAPVLAHLLGKELIMVRKPESIASAASRPKGSYKRNDTSSQTTW